MVANCCQQAWDKDAVFALSRTLLKHTPLLRRIVGLRLSLPVWSAAPTHPAGISCCNTAVEAGAWCAVNKVRVVLPGMLYAGVGEALAVVLRLGA